MVIREYGTENKKHLVFFQGSCEPWEELRPAAELLAREFHVLLVTPDGHDPEEHNDFISVEKTVDDTARWLKEHGIGHLDAMYGLSFGGGMVLRFLTTQDIPVDRAIIDAGTAPRLATRIQFWVGTDEWGSRFRDLKWAMRYLPQIEIVNIPHMMHGEFVMMHPEELAQKAMDFLQ